MKMRMLRNDDDALAYIKEVEVAFQHNTKKYNEFLKFIMYFEVGITRISPQTYDEYLNLSKARVKKLLKEHTYLILGFNTFLPKQHHITLPFQETNGKRIIEENRELPWDVLDIISKTLDFDDHFQFADVCKNWRAFHKIYWRNFLASQEPLLLQISCYCKGSFSFISIPDLKVDCSKMGKYFSRSAYVTISSGYFIMAGYSNNPFMLMNPFTRTKKVINTPTDCSYLTKRALLAFGKCSEEFVLVILCHWCLHVYQSRNCGWGLFDNGRSRKHF